MKQAIIAIIGVIIGVLLDQIFIGRRQKRKEEKQSKSVRTMTILEIDQNLSSLTKFWHKLTDGVISTEFRKRFVEMSIPKWSHKVWESLISFMPTSLNENEIKQVWNFHDQLDLVSDYHTKLSSGESNEPAILWSKCDSIINRLLKKGNPLHRNTS